MSDVARLRYLPVALIFGGLIFTLGVYPLLIVWWPSGWRLQPNQPEYEPMIPGGRVRRWEYFCFWLRETRCRIVA